MELENGARILFQGDSVTDAGRTFCNPNGLGTGYPLIISEILQYRYPEKKAECINRAVSGNRVRDLAARWSTDAIALNPDIICILIGVNDTWRRFDSNDPTSAERFMEEYSQILDRCRKETHAKLILLSPFVLPINEERMSWDEDLNGKIEVVRQLAKEVGAEYIPLQQIFQQEVLQNNPDMPSTYAGDGVHPTLTGHTVIARELLNTLGLTL